jgi:glutaminyl-tRNA synthetase
MIPSPYRDRSVDENLREFTKMTQGRYEEGTATLRLKMNMKSPNPCMRDLVAYRIKYVPHPHVGTKYCVYPSYDFTHCINDSFEDITHSLCTLEFLPRRESYMWLLDALEMYKPVVWEFSRLNITYTVMSKRKLLTLVNNKYVTGWDDPRMTTLVGLRRRGYSPAAIREFCDAVGVTTNTIVWTDFSVLEHYARRDMEVTATRAMAVVSPLRVEIINYPKDKVELVSRPNHPADKTKGTNQVPFSRVLYIDRNDFKEQKSADFWGLSVGSEVGLRYAYNITCTEVVKDKEGNIEKLLCTYDEKNTNNPKGRIHWVAQSSEGKEPNKAQLRLYDHLFKSAHPDDVEDWIADININSITTIEVSPFLFASIIYFHFLS